MAPGDDLLFWIVPCGILLFACLHGPRGHWVAWLGATALSVGIFALAMRFNVPLEILAIPGLLVAFGILPGGEDSNGQADVSRGSSGPKDATRGRHE